jgi:hypothetical protein
MGMYAEEAQQMKRNNEVAESEKLEESRMTSSERQTFDY